MRFGRDQKFIKPSEALERLQDSFADDILTMSDEEIRRQAVEEGVDLAASAEFVRGALDDAIQSIKEGGAGNHSGKFAKLDWDAIRTAAIDWANQHKLRVAEKAARSNPSAATKRGQFEADR